MAIIRAAATPGRSLSKFDFNKCCSFTNATNRITFTAPASFNPATLVNFTFAAWCKIFSHPSGGSRVVDFTGAQAGGFSVIPSLTSGYSCQVNHNPTAGATNTGYGTIKLGEWQRILFTWTNTDNFPLVYINAINYPGVTTNKSGTRANISTLTMVVGNRVNTWDRPFNGLMDEVCLWNGVLTDAQIKDDYYNRRQPVTTTGLILRYAMNEASGNLTDASVSGLTGTPTNVTQNVASYSSVRSS